MTTWRYQPIFQEHDGERYYSLCEVYFDEDEKLSSWTAKAEMAPIGEDVADLVGSLSRMWVDALSWEPVRFSDLKPGMIFERKLANEERKSLAARLEQFARSLD
jgi:hypothetical protein